MAVANGEDPRGKLLFTEKDVQGREIECYEREWSHILDRHRYLNKNLEKRIRAAITSPIAIFKDDLRPERKKVYYRIEGNKYLKVVVELGTFSDNDFIVTAHPADSIKDGEELIWMKKSLGR